MIGLIQTCWITGKMIPKLNERPSHIRWIMNEMRTITERLIEKLEKALRETRLVKYRIMIGEYPMRILHPKPLVAHLQSLLTNC